MSKYKDVDNLIATVELALKHLKAAKKDAIIVRECERRGCFCDAAKELKLIDGAMCTVGESAVSATVYQFRFEIEKEG